MRRFSVVTRRPSTFAAVIEFFAVPPGEDAAFRAAWAAEAPPGVALHRALRADVQPRFAALAPRGDGGVLLIARFDARRLPAWRAALDVFAARRGYRGAWLLDGPVGVVHWSSPLMYARTVREHGDPLAALGGRAALYVRDADPMVDV